MLVIEVLHKVIKRMQAIDLHDQASGKAINDKVRLYARIGQALLDASKPAAIRSRPSTLSCRGRISPRA